MAGAPPAAAAVPPALSMSSPEAVDFLAMLAERQTALEARQDTVDALWARLDALSASFAAYTEIMPVPQAYYIVLEVPEGTQLADVRRSVLAAVATGRSRPDRVSVRCFLHTPDLWQHLPHTSAAVVFVTADISPHERDPEAAAEFASMHVNLARCGMRVLQTHAVMSEMEELYFLHLLRDNEELVPIRAAAELPPFAPHQLSEADFALGWCRRIQLAAIDQEDAVYIRNWAEATRFHFPLLARPT